jgi:RNA polymerase sigma-70 factor (ECF subfamily)
MRASDVEAALLRLKVGERKALLLIADGISYIEAAATCGCEVGTIKSRVSRARVDWAALLGEHDPVRAVSITWRGKSRFSTACDPNQEQSVGEFQIGG